MWVLLFAVVPDLIDLVDEIPRFFHQIRVKREENIELTATVRSMLHPVRLSDDLEKICGSSHDLSLPGKTRKASQPHL